MSQADAAVVQLPDDERPTKCYNIQADLPEPLPPPKDPETGPSRLKSLPELLLAECLRQENSTERWIEIPPEVQELYRQAGRPRPLIRAHRLEKRLGTPAHLYYKTEFYSPTGSHKVNTALAQAWYAKQEGYERLTTETGAGQWGTALAYAASLAELKTTIYWVRAVHDWKIQRRQFMKLYGATVHASPSSETSVGRALLAKRANHPGSLGIAVSEGLEDAKRDEKAIYCLGSVLNHVLLHQTIIGLETQRQFEQIGAYPDIMVSSLGGGSNFGGFTLPFLADAIKGRAIRFIAAQSAAAPNLQGEYRYDFADHAELTPLLKMYTLGHKTEMRPVKGDGLRYHGCSPILSLLRHRGFIDTIAYPEDERYVFERARQFVQAEGFLPAPEAAYRVAFASDRIVLWSYRAKLVAEAEAPGLYRVVRQVTQQANLPMPKVAIVPTETPNAFATGRNPQHAVVAVTQGILHVLTEDELRGVLAHEVSHVRNRDILVMSVAATLAGAISFMGRAFGWNMMFGGSRSRDSNGFTVVIALIGMILAPIAALLVQLAISRSREYKADYSGAKTIGQPLVLASALEKLEVANRRRPITFGSPASQSLFIVNPFSGGAFVRIFSTHPPIQERIARLRDLAQGVDRY